MHKIFIGLTIGIIISVTSVSLAGGKYEPVYHFQHKASARIGDQNFQVFRNGKWEDILIKGVNLGIAKPGYFPGETAITKEEYSRWLKYIGEMNANAIRIYTIHPPEFYQALYEYNLKEEKPIYLFHGVWVNEEILLETNDAFAIENTNAFREAITDTIDVIHGQANIEKIPGHAGGEYSVDISPYVIGWILGIEWNPYVVQNTNKVHKNVKQFNGKYLFTESASSFEIWLAEIMEYTIDYEMKHYGLQRPVSFINWPTTDLLDHPAEPFIGEDLVEINPNHIKATNDFTSKIFASYHIYPYYPDFMNYETDYVNYIDKEGQNNNYAGYLNHLYKKHDIPILVAEFGVPASRGMAHQNVYGMNQGYLSEKEQGEINAKLYKTIINEGYAGGIVFSWQDEWFKRTWNTMDYDNPNRRPYWLNVQTNEQHFGLLSFDPGQELKIKLDGKTEDWEKAELTGVYKQNTIGNLKNLYVTSDEGYLYLRVDYQDSAIDFNKQYTYILLDTIDNQGNTSLPHINNLKSEIGIDFIIQLNREHNSKMLVDSYYDSFYFQYGHLLKLAPNDASTAKKDSGLYNPIRLALNKELLIPSQNKIIPFQAYETGNLIMGISDPLNNQYNSLADFYLDEEKKILEIRIPWALLNVKDPSKHEIISDIWQYGLKGSKTIEGVRVGVVTYDSSYNILSSLPRAEHNLLKKETFHLYQWRERDFPTNHERLKQSYYIMQKLYANFN